MVARRVRSNALVMVQLFQILTRELAHAVITSVDDLVAVHLQHVAVAFVDQQAADRKPRVVHDLVQVAGVAVVNHAFDRFLNAQCVHGRLSVDGERVVHVEPDPLDRTHSERTVHEDAIGTWYCDAVGR